MADDKTMTPQNPQPAWSVCKLAAETGHSTRMIRRRIRNGELPAIKFGKAYRIPADIAYAIVAGVPVAAGEKCVSEPVPAAPRDH